MSTRAKWGCVWVGWAAYFAIAEGVAISSGEYDAPLSSHLRYILGAKHPALSRRAAGAVVIAGGSVWLIDHLFRGVIDDVSMVHGLSETVS